MRCLNAGRLGSYHGSSGSPLSGSNRPRFVNATTREGVNRFRPCRSLAGPKPRKPRPASMLTLVGPAVSEAGTTGSSPVAPSGGPLKTPRVPSHISVRQREGFCSVGRMAEARAPQAVCPGEGRATPGCRSRRNRASATRMISEPRAERNVWWAARGNVVQPPSRFRKWAVEGCGTCCRPEHVWRQREGLVSPPRSTTI